MAKKITVVKVGGSLFDWPELIPRLRAFVEPLQKNKIFLFPGGGPLTDVIREYDRVHQLGEERSHWLAIKTLQINSLLLSAIFPSTAARSASDTSATTAKAKKSLTS